MKNKLDPKDVERLLKENGFTFCRYGKGSHKVYKRKFGKLKTLALGKDPCYISLFRFMTQYDMKGDWFIKKYSGGK